MSAYPTSVRLATITNWAYGATVTLTLVSGATMFLASSAHSDERAAVEQRYTLDQATATLIDETNRLTGQARQFVITGDPSHIVVYRRELASLESIKARIARIGDAGATTDELEALREAIDWADSLQEEQQLAIAAWQKGDQATARQIMFGAEYEREVSRIESAIERFQYRLDQRVANDVADATQLSKAWRTVSEFAMAITGLLFVCVLYFILRRRILKPVVRLSDVVSRLAAQDFQVDLPEFDQVDEIGDMAQAIRVFQQNGLERQRLEKQRDEDMRIRELMSRMTQRMQSCETLSELGEVVARFVPEIASGSAGRLYLRDKSRNAMSEVAAWRNPVAAQTEFSPLACWALRRGMTHRFDAAQSDMPCEHLSEAPGILLPTICLPLTAQQDTIGLLYLEQERTEGSLQLEVSATYLEMLAENISLAIANLQLRRELSDQAMIDPLTGLSNRRKLANVLGRLGQQTGNSDLPVSCLILDIDHFKHFNDQFGHDAGDEVLRQVGSLLNKLTRGGDEMAFRYGGEEFVVLIPGLESSAAVERAETIRLQIKSLDLYHEGKALGTISASVGVASAPAEASLDRLVHTADGALLIAKEAGRDQVIVSGFRDRDLACSIS